jgi:hypothetical protein
VKLQAFEACITQTRFLVVDHLGLTRGVVARIKDSGRSLLVGEVTTGSTPKTLGGAVAGNGPYVMSTATPLGRDSNVIERCWDRYFPIAPTS